MEVLVQTRHHHAGGSCPARVSSRHNRLVANRQARISRWRARHACAMAVTLLVIKPTNDALLAIEQKQAGRHSRALIERWGRLHIVRTVLGLLGVLSFLLPF